ncbi:MAG: hypothetical protein ABW321_11680 [Polyangiales bacterium]
MSSVALLADAEEQLLVREHQRLGRHIADIEVTPYQIEKYLAFHRSRSLEPRTAFDHLLLRLSRSGRFGLLLADAYSGTLYRVCVVRMKLMLTLAILECSSPSFRVLDAPDSGQRWVFAKMAGRVAIAAIALVCAIVVLAPVHVYLAALAPSRAQPQTTHKPTSET